MKWASIYVVGRKATEPPAWPNGGPTKIGIAGNPQARLSNLQTSCPFAIELYATLSLPRELAAVTEQLAHEAFESHRLQGEWFDIAPLHGAIGVLDLARDVIRELAPSENDAADFLRASGMTGAMNFLVGQWRRENVQAV